MAGSGYGSEGFPRPYGKFELLRRLGDGGMAEVFLARLPGVAGFQKTLVLKRILPHLARKKHFIDLFVAEASLAAEVRHRNVVQVFELGQVEGELYMAMEYVEGHDLRRLLRYASRQSLRVPPWFTVHVVCEVLEALAYAYDLRDEHGRPRRVVHRDVTPSNVFVSEQGEVKLGDFGVARDDTRGDRTRAGQLKGKVAYMAPEQLYSQAIDQRTDLFGIGVVLWECLAQRRLFGGRPDIEIMNAICEGPRTPPGARLKDVPPELDAIVLKALEPRPEDRWGSAVELQRALFGVLEQLRPRVTSADVRSVLRALTRASRGPESGLDGLQQVKSGSSDSGPSFTALSAGDEPSHRSGEVLANPAYGGRGDSIADLSVDLDRAEAFGGLTEDLGFAPPTPLRRVSSRAGLEPVEAPAVPKTPSRPTPGLYGHVRSRAPSAPPRPSSSPRADAAPPRMPPPRVVTGTPIPGAPRAPRPRAPSAGGAAAFAQSQPLPQDVPIVRGTADVEVDVDALVAEAVEDVRASLPDAPTIEQSSLIAGLDSRRLKANSRHLVSDRWAFLLDRELYEGPHPFHIVDHEGSRVGPCSYEQALTIAKMEVKAGFGERSRIGASPDRLMPVRQALELWGMQTLVRAELPVDGAPRDGEGRTPIRLFADYTRHPISGRLVLYRDRDLQGDYREIEMLAGEPTFVWTEHEDYQYPKLLVSKRLMRPEALAELAHGTLEARRPLEAVAAARLGVDLSRYRPMLMKERLVDLFTKGYASHIVQERTELVHTESFGPNLLQLALELCFRCVPRQTIAAAVTARSSRKLRVADDFDRLMSQLSLSPEILSAVGLLTKGKTLDRLLETYPAQRRTLTTLLFFLTEADLLYVDA